MMLIFNHFSPFSPKTRESESNHENQKTNLSAQLVDVVKGCAVRLRHSCAIFGFER